MVIGLLVVTSIPVVTGVAEGLHANREHETQEVQDARLAKFNLDVHCDEDPAVATGPKSSASSRKKEELKRRLNGMRVVLRDGKVWLDEPLLALRSKPSYTAQCFYVNYPDEDREKTLGLVSRIQDEPPALNWLYIHGTTLEIRYGNRTESRTHHIGPWDWTDPEDGEPENEKGGTESGKGGAGLTLEGWEGFVAVEEGKKDEWALYYDRGDDGMRGVESVRGKRRMEVTLERVLCDVESDRAKD